MVSSSNRRDLDRCYSYDGRVDAVAAPSADGSQQGGGVAVIVPTYSRARMLPRLIAGLEAQLGDLDFEVVVVDDASKDDTAAVLEQIAATSPLTLRLIRQPRNRGPAAARNLGWRSTTAQVVVFTDDDCTAEPGWLTRLVAGADHADIVQGRTIPDPTELDQTGPFSRTLTIEHEDGFYQTCNIAYRRHVLEEAGGFDEAFRFAAGEDTDLAWRAREAGAKTAFLDDAVVRHTVRPSSFLRRSGRSVAMTSMSGGDAVLASCSV